ncbi:hypothetical protein [Nocardia sp. NPDC050718]|uniref:hypothetical protein n=1 Tax=Nocardia sp. NPDC050718 TaxID=3155788 RepID=UPI0033C660CB
MTENGEWWSTPRDATHLGPGFPPTDLPSPDPAPGSSPGVAHPPYLPPQPYAPRPRYQSRRSGWLVGALCTLSAIAVFAAIAIWTGDDSAPAATAPDIATVLPGLAPNGYAGLSCTHRTSRGPLTAPNTDNLQLGDWTEAWDCAGLPEQPGYAVLAYPAKSDVRGVISRLPQNTNAFGRYDAYTWHSSPYDTPQRSWKAIVFTDDRRSRFLVLAQTPYWQGTSKGMSTSAFDTWCAAMPFG